MPRTFLDLTDEIIARIGYFANQDNFIPLPSFTPHWENFASDIHKDVTKDLISFRTTCRRVRKNCKLEGLHLVISRWDQVQELLTKGPEGYLKAIRRIRLSVLLIPHNDAVSQWFTFTLLLHRIPNLEELIIGDVPFCNHKLPHKPQELRIPPYPFLKNLKSLSVDPKCSDCAGTLPLLFVPSAPKIQHLRLRLTKSGHIHEHEDPDIVEYCSRMLFHILKDLWAERNPDQEMTIRTVYLRGLPEAISPNVFSDIREICLSANKGDDEEIDRWQFEIFIVEIQPEDENELFCSTIDEFYRWLELPQTVKEFDLIMVIQLLDTERPTAVSPNFGDERQLFAKKREKHINVQQRYTVEEHEARVKDAIVSAARQSLKVLPNLEKGYFWETIGWPSPAEWYRWTWKKVIHANGNNTIEVAEVPQFYNVEFVKCREGL